jgi:hypothetical protein
LDTLHFLVLITHVVAYIFAFIPFIKLLLIEVFLTLTMEIKMEFLLMWFDSCGCCPLGVFSLLRQRLIG